MGTFMLGIGMEELKRLAEKMGVALRTWRKGARSERQKLCSCWWCRLVLASRRGGIGEVAQWVKLCHSSM